MILDLFYLSLIAFAIIALQTRVLRNAIIYLSVFSLLCSIVYLLLGAPDVAIAEAAIGCTLSTILYLVALKKYRIFTVYYNCYAKHPKELEKIGAEKDQIVEILNTFSGKGELQLDIINTSSGFTHLKENAAFDVIIFHSPKGIWIHGLRNSYQYNELIELLRKECPLPLSTYYIDEDPAWSLGGDSDDA